LTPSGGNHKISPESSDGFASVGTILPREEAALLPGGLFVFPVRHSRTFFTRGRTLDTIRQGTCKRGRADVAQLVEQLIRNQQVIGSSPIVGSINSTASGLQQAPRHSTQVQKTQAFPFLVPALSLVPDYPLFFWLYTLRCS
jgi:hypothetical protein